MNIRDRLTYNKDFFFKMENNSKHILSSRKLGSSQVQAVNEFQLSVADSVFINIQDDEPGKTILLSWTHQVSKGVCVFFSFFKKII